MMATISLLPVFKSFLGFWGCCGGGLDCLGGLRDCKPPPPPPGPRWALAVVGANSPIANALAKIVIVDLPNFADMNFSMLPSRSETSPYCLDAFFGPRFPSGVAEASERT